ncbi:Rieske (2Fe-2S) protein [Pseudalkalibacillus sp. A8]|uniref:Rieske (2Fe-2S) protein n=1 Tax=Pseudalkalibacillus sp. A8 TaxID=3382641 RepID=UPI0038B618C0
MEIKACHQSELEQRKSLTLELEGKTIGIIRDHNYVYAYENNCPHFGGPVCLGGVFGKINLELDETKMALRETVSDEDLRLVCPWHAFEYDLRTGECVVDSKLKLQKYDAYIKDEHVFVKI